MKVGDLVYYAPCLPRERVLGMIVGMHESGDMYGYKLKLWHILWVGDDFEGHQTHEPTEALEEVKNVDKE